MHYYSRRLIYLSILAITSCLFSPKHSVLAADAAVTIKIIKTQGQFVFDQPNVTIKVGQPIQWVATTGTHDMIPDDGAANAEMQNTGIVDTAHPSPQQTFTKTGVIHYHCEFHPTTMTGVITVQ
jgi:plastocyanin